MHRFGYDAQAFTEMQTLMLVLTGTGLIVGAVVSERKQADRLVQDRRRKGCARRRAEATALRASAWSVAWRRRLAHEINQPMTAARALGRSVQHLLESRRPICRGPEPISAMPSRRSITPARSCGACAIFCAAARPHVSTIRYRHDVRRCDGARAAGRDGARHRSSCCRPMAFRRRMATAMQLQQVVLNLVRNATDAIAVRGAKANGGVERAPPCRNRRMSNSRARQRTWRAPTTSPTGYSNRSPLQSSKGWGSGLSISQGIVESHGGRIWLHSRAPGATEFRFTLPLETLWDGFNDRARSSLSSTIRNRYGTPSAKC